MAERLIGKNAVITGASTGMGKGMTLAFLKEGANVVAVARRLERLEALKAEAEALGLGDKLAIMAGDVSKSEDCAAAFELCDKTFGTCNVMVQNAGIMDNFARVADIDDEVWNKVIAVNMTGVMYMLRAGIRYFLAHETPASVIVTTSDAVAQQATGGSAYSASKCGAAGLIGAAAFEYSSKGIRFNQICPGAVDTNISESMGAYKSFDMEGMQDHMSRGYNAHKAEWVCKVSGTPDDIAPVAVFLASDESGFVNNQRIMVNGGLNLG